MGEVAPTVILITNIPTPYRIPLFNLLADRFLEAGLKLHVVFSMESYSRRHWEIDFEECRFEYTILNAGYRPVGGNQEKAVFRYRGLGGILRGRRPVAIISSGFSSATIRTAIHSLRYGTPFWIWSGAIHARAPGWPRMLVRWILARLATGGIAYGSLAREYLLGLGMKVDRVSIAINTVDTEHFACAVDLTRGKTDPSHSCKRLVYVGHLTARKNVEKILELAERLLKVRNDFVVEIAGKGDQLSLLEDRVRDTGMGEVVRFHGYLQNEELPDFLAGACCFLFPTSFDIWGLVLVEAMAAGLPCFASVHAGATRDLIQDGTTGFCVDFEDMDSVVEKVNLMLDHPNESRRMGENASEFIRRSCTLDACVDGFIGALRGASLL